MPSTKLPTVEVPDRVIPCPSRKTMSKLADTNRSSTMFLQAAGIQHGSATYKDLTKTVQALSRQYLHPFKHVREQPSKVERVVAQARVRLPWLGKYEDGWPARVYMERYADHRLRHLKDPRNGRKRKLNTLDDNNLGAPDDAPMRNHDSIVRQFLGSLKPSLERHHDAFVELGIKDQETLQAFVSWPQAIQARFLDEDHRTLRLTNLERTGLLIGCGRLAHKAMERCVGGLVKPECF